jgi:hypothetical protein
MWLGLQWNRNQGITVIGTQWIVWSGFDPRRVNLAPLRCPFSFVPALTHRPFHRTARTTRRQQCAFTGTGAKIASMGSLEEELQKIYDSEIHVDIGWLWDGGIDVSIGNDEVTRHVRMLGPAGNPRADNLFEVVTFLRRRQGVRFHVKAAKV